MLTIGFINLCECVTAYTYKNVKGKGKGHVYILVPGYTQKRFCNITVVFGGCLVAQNTVAEIWSNAW